MNQPLVSVLIPVYNGEKYLPACLDGVVGQTYKNLEIIIVDDGSADSTPAVCAQYAAADSRIRLLRQENAGVGAARNLALKHVSGEYICWVDADDECSADMVELLWQALVENGADMSMCGFENDEALWRGALAAGRKAEKAVIFEGQGKLKELITLDIIRVPLWGKLYKKSLFDGLVFPSVRLAEDSYATAVIGDKTGRTAVIQSICYYYRQNPESLMHTKGIAINLESLHGVICWLEDAGEDTLDVYRHMIYVTYHDLGRLIALDKASVIGYEEQLREAFEFLKKKLSLICAAPDIGRLGKLELHLLASKVPGRYRFTVMAQKIFEKRAERKRKKAAYCGI